MKYLIALSIAAMFAAPAFAGEIKFKEVITGYREHKTTKNCWTAHGNWKGGESYTSCEFSSGETYTKLVPICDESKKSQGL